MQSAVESKVEPRMGAIMVPGLSWGQALLLGGAALTATALIAKATNTSMETDEVAAAEVQCPASHSGKI